MSLPRIRHTSRTVSASTRSSTIAVLAVIAVVAAALLASTATSSSRSGQAAPPWDLRVFHRPPHQSDALPHSVRSGFPNVVASRRIAAVARSFRGAATLYVARLPRKQICLITVQGTGAGGGCSPSRYFLSRSRRMNFGMGNGFLTGVAGNEVARVEMVDRNAGKHAIHLTRDGGFIYVCRVYGGCSKIFAALKAYDHRGRLVSQVRWHSVRPRTR